MIENKKTSIYDQNGQPLNYAHLAIAVLGAPVANGLTVASMRQRLKLIDILEAADGQIDLSTADLSLLRTALGVHPWPQVNSEIVQFCDAFGVD